MGETDKYKTSQLLQISMATRETYNIWFLIVPNISFAVTAILSNILILAALYKESSLYPPSKMLFRFLAFTDLCVGLLTEPLLVMFLIAIEYEWWNIFDHIKTSSLFVGTSLCSLSLFTLTAISVDRLLALLLGLSYRHVVTCKRVLFIMICFWTLNIALGTAAFWSTTIMSYFTFIATLSCILVSTCCYIKIYHKLHQHQARIQEQVNQGQSNREEPLNLARYRKTVSNTLWVHTTLYLCYLPTGIVIALMAIKGWTQSVWVALQVCVLIVCLNSTLNPMLYCWKIREVRHAAIQIIKQMCGCLS